MFKFGELSRFEMYSELFLVGDSDVSQARLDQIGEYTARLQETPFIPNTVRRCNAESALWHACKVLAGCHVSVYCVAYSPGLLISCDILDVSFTQWQCIR